MLLDAAMGTRLIDRGLDLKHEDPCCWNLDHPAVVAEIHRLDCAAGVDAVTTNTFGANRCWLKRYGRDDDTKALNQAGAELAREAIGPSGIVIGSIGPTADPATTAEQGLILQEAGVDALMLETLSVSDHSLPERVDRLQRPPFQLPLILSFAIVKAKEPLPRRRVCSDRIVAVGWNCLDPQRIVTLPYLITPYPNSVLILQPSGPWTGSEAPFEFNPTPELIQSLRNSGVQMLGGCCGTSDREIRLLRDAINRAEFGRAKSD